MPDVICWIKPDLSGVTPSIEKLAAFSFEKNLSEILCDELKLESPEKIDILGVSLLYKSHSKRVVLHIHAYPQYFVHTTPEAIAEKVKKMLNLPEDEQCVSIGFYEVDAWGKA